MSDCILGDDLRCSACGRPAASKRLRRNCTASSHVPPPPARGLGDLVAAGLSAVGVTKERVRAVANAVGIEDCGCAERQRAMNSWGARHLGIGTKGRGEAAEGEASTP